MSGLVATGVLAATGAGLALTTTLRHAPDAALPLGDREACARYRGLPADWAASPLAGRVRVGDGRGRAFWIDATEVTTAQFAAFVEATGYVTQAERGVDGAVFVAPASAREELSPQRWWQLRAGVDWRHPQGRDAAPAAPNAPVSMVTRADAQAYAAWRGARLPTEAEWEAAARRHGERDDGRDAAGWPIANFWQGLFPLDDRAEDGFHGLAPVGCYAANAQGLYDSIGNVWEWTADDWNGAAQWHGHGEVPRAAPAAAAVAVIKGGSWLCAANYCQRYRSGARHPQEADLPTVHVGFRTVRDA